MSLIRKLRDRLQGATLHDLWVETRWVLHHSKRYRRSIAAYVLLGIASIALSLLSSLSSRELINAIVYLQGGGRRVLFCGVTVVLLAGSTIVLNALVSRFSAKINLRVGNELRAEVFGMFLNTDWESLQQFHSGDLLSRINTDVSNVAGSVLGWIPSLILRLTQFLASLAVILVYDPTMAVLALLSAPVTLLLSRPLVGKMRSFNRDMRAVGSEMTAFQEETLQNIPAIKAFHLVDAFRERLDRVQERYYDTGIAFQRFSILTSSFLSSCGMLVSYLCLGWGAYRLWQGRIDFGTMVLFLQLASYLSSSLSALIHLVPSAIEASVSARRIMSVLELPRERLDHPERAQRLVREGVPLALSLQGLEFSYQGRAPVLKQLDLQVQPHRDDRHRRPVRQRQDDAVPPAAWPAPPDGRQRRADRRRRGAGRLPLHALLLCLCAAGQRDLLRHRGRDAPPCVAGRPGGGPVGRAARRLRRGISSAACPADWTARCANAAARCPRDRTSGWPLRAPFWPMLLSCCSTR